MKILSPPEGEGLLTDAEVLEFLREKAKEEGRRGYSVGVGRVDGKGRRRGRRNSRVQSAAAELDQQVIAALEDGPAGLQSVESVRKLMERLKKFKLAVCEEQMIANLRPDVLPRLLGIIEECNQRYAPEEVEEMRQVIDCTLEKMPFDDEVEDEQKEGMELDGRGESLLLNADGENDLRSGDHSNEEHEELDMGSGQHQNDARNGRLSDGSTRELKDSADYLESVANADGATRDNCAQQEQRRNRIEKEMINDGDGSDERLQLQPVASVVDRRNCCTKDGYVDGGKESDRTEGRDSRCFELNLAHENGPELEQKSSKERASLLHGTP